MRIIKRLIAYFKFRGSAPDYELLQDYETLIRLARRCAYDLSHTVDALPSDHYYVTELGMRERSNSWVIQFAKGNPGKDYRMRLQHDIADLNKQLDDLYKWCDEQGLKPPDRRDIPF